MILATNSQFQAKPRAANVAWPCVLPPQRLQTPDKTGVLKPRNLAARSCRRRALEGAMQRYRLFVFDDAGRVVDAHPFQTPDDESACAWAKHVSQDRRFE